MPVGVSFQRTSQRKEAQCYPGTGGGFHLPPVRSSAAGHLALPSVWVGRGEKVADSALEPLIGASRPENLLGGALKEDLHCQGLGRLPCQPASSGSPRRVVAIR